MNRFWVRSCGLVMSILFAANLFAQPVFEKNYDSPPERYFQAAKYAFEHSEDVWLMRLNPSSLNANCGLCLDEWQVLEIFHDLRANELSRFRAASESFLQHSEEILIAMCFNPRHAIRASYGGHQFDLVICFECGHSRLYRDGVDIGAIPLSVGDTDINALLDDLAHRMKTSAGSSAVRSDAGTGREPAETRPR